MKTQVIIVAGGTGERLGMVTPKPLVDLDGLPLVVYALRVFQESASIDSIILVGHRDRLTELESIVRKHNIEKVKKLVCGGATRRASVFSGLQVLDEDTEFVAIHDAARPLVSVKLIDDVVDLCRSAQAAIIATPVKSTIKRIDTKTLYVKETVVVRDELWEVQTPQVFRKEIILRAHQQPENPCFTDDASMVENLGVRVAVLRGDYRNIKITTEEDLVVAKVLLDKEKDKL